MLKRLMLYLERAVKGRRLYEIAIALMVLIIGAYALSLMSPYKSSSTPSGTLFYETTSNDLNVVAMRAKIVGIQTDTLTIMMLDGPSKGDVRELKKPQRDLQVDDVVLVSQAAGSTDSPADYVSDVWRLPAVLFFILLLAVVSVVIGRRQGLMSFVGLGVTIAVVAGFVIPQIINGANPFLICVVAVYAIAIASLLIAHGIERRTVISIIVILIVLTFVIALSLIAVLAAQLSGMVDETASYLYAGSGIDMRGVLMGSILIATLGVLDDVVTTQVATVDELMKANSKLTNRNIYHRAISVGNEHIAAVINTLALAYVGVALPTLLAMAVYYTSQEGQSLMVFFNSEFIAQEVVRTAVSSIGLILAIPFGTYVAVLLLKKIK